MNIIGLDLSITATGISTTLRDRTYRPKCQGPNQDVRLRWIAEEIRGDLYLVSAGRYIDLAVIEDLPTHAHSAGITGMVHGAVRAMLLDEEIPYVLVAPATLKKFATGRGNCDKTAMAVAALKRAGVEFEDDNACDAWWLRMAGMCAYGQDLGWSVPADQVAALAKVAWPVRPRWPIPIAATR